MTEQDIFILSECAGQRYGSDLAGMDAPDRTESGRARSDPFILVPDLE